MTALLDEDNKGKFLLWEQNFAGGDNPDDIQVVFISQGVRYTVWHNPGLETVPPWLSVWERPNGTNYMDSLDTYTDTWMTGCVNFGIGSEASHGEDRRSMSWNDGIRDEEGLAHHAFWQGRYAFAIRGLADVLGVK